MKASVTTFLLFLVTLVLVVQPSAAQNDSWFPGSVTGIVPDCITDPAVNAEFPEPPDVNGSRECDDYETDVLERPTIQGPEDVLGDYFPSIDIDTVWFGIDDTWLYVGIGIRGLKDGTTIEGKAHFEIDLDPVDGRGDFFVIHEGGKNPDDFTGSFSSTQGKEKLSIYSDGNGDVGGDFPFIAEGTHGGDGYETEEWKSGDDPEDGCSVRQVTRSGGLPRFDFACRKSLIGNPSGGFAVRVHMNKGVAGPSSLYLHDKFTASEYGSPYEDDPHYESGSTYEIDNTPWMPGSQLPVELGLFDVVRSNDEMVLSWSTHSETDNSGFEVQHSIGTKPFEAVAFVPGAGTTRDVKTYTYRYLTEEPGVHRFRLKQIDFDGAFAYSHAVEVAVDLPERFVLETAYPNPFNPSTTIRFGVAEAERVSVRLYDALGREVRVLFAGTPMPNEMHSVTIEAGGLPSGSYVVRLEGSSYVATRMVTLLK